MSNDNTYSIKLANGKEQNFNSAAEMAVWIEDQRDNSVPARKASARKSNRKARNSRRKIRCYSGDSPLTRYANRKSDET